MRKRVFIILLLLHGISNAGFSGLKSEMQLSEIKEIVVKDILNGDTTKIDYILSTKSLITPNTIVVYEEPQVITPNVPCYVAFICKDSEKQDYLWVFINPETKEHEIVQSSFYRQNYKVGFVTILSNKPFKYKRPAPSPIIDGLSKVLSSSSSHKYAVLINGGYYADTTINFEDFYNNLSFMYSTLKNKYGFTNSNIYVLCSDGTNPAPDREEWNESGTYLVNSDPDLDNDGVNDIDYSATKSNIQNIFTNILKNKLTSEDFLFVYVTDHGGQEGSSDVYVMAWGDTRVRDDELASWVQQVNCGTKVFVIDACHSGGFFIEQNGSNGDLINNYCIGASPCRYDEEPATSKQHPLGSYNLYHYWTIYFTAALRGCMPGSYPWLDGDPVDADYNGNGVVSIQEAFDYADSEYWHSTPVIRSSPSDFADHVDLKYGNPKYLYVPDDFASIQDAIDYVYPGGKITVGAGTYYEDITIDNKDYLTIYGQGYPHIEGSLSIYASEALYLYGFFCDEVYSHNCSDPDIRVYIVGNGSGTGLYLYRSGYFEVISSIANFNYGLTTQFSSGNIYPGSQIWDNGTAVYAYYVGNIYLYYAELCGSINYDLRTYWGYIFALDCYYDNGIPRTLGNVEVHGARNCSGLLKDNSIAGNDNQTLPPGQNVIQNGDPALNEFREVNDAYLNLSKRVKEDIFANRAFDKEEFYDDYMGVIKKYRNYIDKYPRSALSTIALANAVHCYRRLEDNEAMKMFLQEIMEDKKLVNLSGLAKSFIILYYSDKKDFNNAILTADEILNEQQSALSATTDTSLVCDVLLTKGLIYSHDLNKPSEAAECFSSIINNYPDNPTVDFAEHELRFLGYDIEKEKKEISVVENLILGSSNYPNPFNPSTTITYDLPEDAWVRLVIYDISGREVVRLVDENQEPGYHAVVWNGLNTNGRTVPTGVYIAKLVTPEYSKSIKMVLMK